MLSLVQQAHTHNMHTYNKHWNYRARCLRCKAVSGRKSLAAKLRNSEKHSLTAPKHEDANAVVNCAYAENAIGIVGRLDVY